MQIIYKSWDGKEFPNAEACQQYEYVNRELAEPDDYDVGIDFSGYLHLRVRATTKASAEAQALAYFDNLEMHNECSILVDNVEANEVYNGEVNY